MCTARGLSESQLFTLLGSLRVKRVSAVRSEPARTMEGTEVDELYLDLPAEDVRPVNAASGSNSPLHAEPGEPDYQTFSWR